MVRITYLSLNGLGGLNNELDDAVLHGVQQHAQVLHVFDGLGAAGLFQQLFPVVEIAHGACRTFDKVSKLGKRSKYSQRMGYVRLAGLNVLEHFEQVARDLLRENQVLALGGDHLQIEVQKFGQAAELTVAVTSARTAALFNTK